ncbi:hypothetical protein PHPALM_31925 [Phytophthora palmivora]|uniref:Retrotransposon gag domain-containing protein n=1 Tax=Phytophthora palmivora TaxID=4796 RepID=A0A2P4X1E0_9STRA|nr:hypothetical protein PHPALM_31925 [Phytophthora palmivora]
MSGASQAALNTMRTTQDLLSRMESNQAQIRLLGQQVQQAFHAIQALAVRGSPPEGRSSQSVPDRPSRSDLPPRPPAPAPAARTPASPRTVDAARAEGAHTALESARIEFEERWQQREAKAEEEKVAWVADVQKTLSAQLEAFQQKIHSLEEARNRDQETIRDLQNVQGMRSRNTPATHPQAQDIRATYRSDPATQVKSEPTRATMYPLPGNAIKGHTGERRDIKFDSDLPAEQLQLTLQSLTGTNYAKEDEAVKSEQTPGVKSSSVSRPKFQVRETKPVAPEKTDAKKPAKKDSNWSIRVKMEILQGLVLAESQATKATAQATLVLTLRTFTNTLEDFDEKLALSARRRWWERFLNVTVQGGWTDQMKVYELKTKMSPAVRNWYGQLSKHVRSEWSRLSKEFKREYCKSRVSESEKYYTMKPFKDETALAFLYRLNLAAERADVRFRKSERRREQHIKRFIKNLTLKTTLQSQRFRKVSDLEYVLNQHEEVNPSGVHSGRGAQPRDFRADNVARNGPRMNRPNRAYVAQDDEAQGFDTQVTFEDDERADLAALSTCVQDALRDGNPDANVNPGKPHSRGLSSDE